MSEKLPVKTADCLERRIIDEGWPTGTLIGSEAQLLKEFGVSRAVLREAILILEQRQIAERQRGLGGGVRVRAPTAKAVARAISLFLEFSGVTPDDLLEARMLLEGHCAAKAARNADPEQVQALKDQAVAGLTMRGERAREQMAQFHVLLAKLAGNPVWALVTEALVEAAASLLQRIGRMPTEAEIREQFKHLVAVAEAIESRDEERAREEVSRFIRHVQRYYRENAKKPRAKPGAASAAPRARRAAGSE